MSPQPTSAWVFGTSSHIRIGNSADRKVLILPV